MRGEFWHEKSLRDTEGFCIHVGGDEGDRTPDLLTASQALSQLSYAPVTRRYYRGRFLVVQEVFWVDSRTYGFYRDGTLLVEVSDCGSLVDLDLGRLPDDIRDARVSQES